MTENVVNGTVVNHVAKVDGDIMIVSRIKWRLIACGQDKAKVKEGQVVKVGDEISGKLDAKASGIVSLVDTEKVVVMQSSLFHCGHGSLVFVQDKDSINANEVIKREKRYHGGAKARDIVAGLPKVEALFEARVSKNKAILTEVAGTVEIISRDNLKIVVVYNESGKQEYKVPGDTRVTVNSGDKVDGTMLTGG